MLYAIPCAAKRLAAISLMLLATFGTAITASAEFPERSITLIVPFPAGGPTDALARVLRQRMPEELKQPIVIENVGGAASVLGTARAAKATPDGYTILINDLALPSAPAWKSSLPFDVRADFVPLGLINGGPMVLIGRKSLGADKAQQLFAKIKTEKDNVKLGHGGIGTNSHMCGLLIQRVLGVTVTAVSYRGTGPAMNDLVAGTLDIVCDQSTNSGHRRDAIGDHIASLDLRYCRAPFPTCQLSPRSVWPDLISSSGMGSTRRRGRRSHCPNSQLCSKREPGRSCDPKALHRDGAHRVCCRPAHPRCPQDTLACRNRAAAKVAPRSGNCTGAVTCNGVSPGPVEHCLTDDPSPSSFPSGTGLNTSAAQQLRQLSGGTRDVPRASARCTPLTQVLHGVGPSQPRRPEWLPAKANSNHRKNGA